MKYIFAHFNYVYVSVFLVVFGMYQIVRANRLSDPKQFFQREMKDKELGMRLRTVLERRRTLEAFPPAGYVCIGAVSVALGIASAFKLLIPVLAYASLCLFIAIVLSILLLRIRNTGERRAATLVPRSAASAVNGTWYGCAVVTSLLPLVFWTTPDLRPASILIAASSLTIVIMSIRIAGMASILTGEDSELEIAVDERLRCSRVAMLLLLAYTVPFVLFGMSPSSAENTFYQVFAFAWCGAFWLAFFSRCVYGYLRPIALPQSTQWHPIR